MGHFALLDPDPDTESGTSLNPINSGHGSGSESIALVLLTWSVVSRGLGLRMAAKRRSGRVTKQEVKYFKEESSDEDEEEV